MGTQVAIYCRISVDRDGRGLGVSRQEEDCRALAKARGWDEIEVFTDNDISASSGKKRPRYLEMMRRIANKEFNVLIAYSSDRLHRSLVELESFIETCNSAKVDILTVRAGDLNLSTEDGRLQARLLGTFARAESEKTSSRLQRKAYDKAVKGEPWSTGSRPFGYEADCITINKSEAVILKEVVKRVLAGESINSVCKWMYEKEILTPAGKPFKVKALKDVLMRARNCGLREYKGEIVAEAVWEPIISREEYDAIVAIFKARKLTGPVARSYLLTGIIRCGICGKKLISNRKDGAGRYLCRKDPVTGVGCGGIYVSKKQVEEFISAAVLTRLNSPEMERALADKSDNSQVLAIHTELSQIGDRQVELAEMVAMGEMTRVQYQAAMKKIDTKKSEMERILSKERGAVFMDGDLATPELIVSKWSGLNLDRQRAILMAVLESVLVFKSPKKGYGFDHRRLKPVWKF